MNFNIEELKFNAQGLIPAIVQDAHTHTILTVAYMNAESLRRTLETKETWFWSRSRQKLWHKGETSGNTQHVVGVLLDCDQDALVLLVEPKGPACHTGEASCFHNTLAAADQTPIPGAQSQHSGQPVREKLGATLEELYSVIVSRREERPAASYTTYLFNEGLDKILKKVGEEAAETIIAAKNDERQPLLGEAADLIFHLLVLLVERGITLAEISGELAGRRGARRHE
jgi:phosphoribosyl-AMP cyclohydrolase / phosphoribosyl-ATP pyrophosphohydrolase